VLDSVLNRNVYLSSLVDAGTAQRRRIPDPNGTANRRTVIGEKGTVGVIGRSGEYRREAQHGFQPGSLPDFGASFAMEQ